MTLCFACGTNIFTPSVIVDFSVIRDKLRTESGPASVRPDEVVNIIQSVERDLQDYDTEIQRLESRRTLLAAQRENLKQYASEVQSLLSPVRKVPDEILQCIFDDCCATNNFKVNDFEDTAPIHASQGLRDKPVIVVSSVCTRWRRNALSTPALWSRLTLQWDIREDNGYPKNDHSKLFSLLYKVLERSQQWPMKISLFIGQHPFVERGVLHPVLEKFLGHLSHWQCLSLDCSHTFSVVLAGMPSVSFPVLKTLCIPRHAWVEDVDPFIGRSPNLKELQLSDELFPDFDYSLLSHLDFHPREDSIQVLFEHAPNLHSLRVTETWNSVNVLYSLSMTSSSRLEILTVCHGYCDYNLADDICDSVWAFLQLPSLKVLHLQKYPDDTQNEDKRRRPLPYFWPYFELFMEFVQRSSLQLTSLSIQSLALPYSNLVHLLIHLPTLKDLTIDDSLVPSEYSPISSEFIESLHCGSFSSSLHSQISPIVPRLHSLRLLNIGATDFRDTSVVDMVQSRWIPERLLANNVEASTLQVDCLREFTLGFRNRSEKEANGIYKSLDQIEKDGMRIVVSWDKIQ